MPEFVGQLPVAEIPWSTLGAVKLIEQNSQAVTFSNGTAQLRLSVLAANLIRVRLAPTGMFLPRRSWSVTRDDDDWLPAAFELQETDAWVELTTAALRVRIERASGRLTCFDCQDRPFAQDETRSMGWRPGSVACWKQIEPDEHFYGFGERTGLLDQIGRRLTNWTTDSLDYHALTDAMYQAIPFFLVLRPQLGYGIFLNTTCRSQFDVGADEAGVCRMQAETSELDYYILYGPEPATILHTYTDLTGRMPLPPRWALGYHQCRWSYNSEAEVQQLAQEFRQRRLPCDVIHLDIDYMQGFRVFTWNRQRFPQPQALIQTLTEAGFKVVTIVDPGVKFEPEGDYAVFDEGLEQDYFVRDAQGKVFHGYVWPDRAVFPDFLRPEVRRWWGDWHHVLTDAGVAGIWNDMNEPAMNDRPFGDPGVKIWFPLDAPQGPLQERTDHAETHNLYGMMMARAAAEGLERLRPQTRSFVLTRAGFAGIQRWSAVWTGDNHSRWEYLEMSLPMLCNLGLSGVAFVGADIGGFAGNATAELFARWIQVGMLYPLMRAHSIIGSMRHEPWVFGEHVEQICRQYIELRYQLLPYLYTLFWEAATTGAPILRPLLYHFPNDPHTSQLFDQVMLGPSLMAAPVCRPGIECRSVYLPEGTWYDWWTREKHEGGQHILASAPLDRMPLYVKAGAVIPLAPVMQHVEELPLKVLRIKIWSGNGEWTLYEDDGDSFEYRDGAWATTTYRVALEGSQTIVCIDERSGQWMPPPRTVIVEVVGLGEQSFEDDGSARQLVFSGESSQQLMRAIHDS
ncbi:MAG: DUF4968 domain-containing protein [Synechococcales cyanobacterium C42_A2020_086]|jgi:alpha-glucosidase|nr:DUF4968 domain-containing protein [Synechococcales cyanobacterium C42_A2020_086]